MVSMTKYVISGRLLFSMWLMAIFVPPALLQHLLHIPDAEISDSTPAEQLHADTEPESNGRAEEFVATHDWQLVKEGQSVPKGLHIRMNLQTGVKEAKLLDEDPGQVQTSEQRNVKTRKMSVALEEALKNIATSHDEPSGNKDNVSSVSAEKQTFRSIEEITEIFSKQNVTLSSEMEILTKLFTQLAESDEPNVLLSILEDVEFYVHNFDNAVYFADLGGIALLTRLINSSVNVGIQAKAALVIGSAAQSNVYVTEVTRSSQTIPVVVRQLRATADESLINRLLFVLSSLVRTSEESLHELIKLRGGELLRSIVEDDSSSLKSVMKVYTLMSDLISKETEYENLVSGVVAEFLIQDDLSGALCRHLSSTLQRSTNISHTEKLLIWLQQCVQKLVCKEYSADLVSSLTALEIEYRDALSDPDLHEYYKQVIDIITQLKSRIAQLSRHSSKPPVDEL